MVETHNPVPAQRPVTEEASILPIWDLDRLLCHHRSLQRPPSYLNGLKLSGLWWEQLLNNISPKKTTNKTSTTIKICRNTKLSVSVVRLSFVWLILERLKTILQAVKAVNWEVSNKNMASFGCSYRTLYKPLFWPPCPLILNQKGIVHGVAWQLQSHTPKKNY